MVTKPKQFMLTIETHGLFYGFPFMSFIQYATDLCLNRWISIVTAWIARNQSTVITGRTWSFDVIQIYIWHIEFRTVVVHDAVDAPFASQGSHTWDITSAIELLKMLLIMLKDNWSAFASILSISNCLHTSLSIRSYTEPRNNMFLIWGQIHIWW